MTVVCEMLVQQKAFDSVIENEACCGFKKRPVIKHTEIGSMSENAGLPGHRSTLEARCWRLSLKGEGRQACSLR